MLLNFVTNTWLGTGFEDFLLGPRLGSVYAWRPNQAHNGYLEINLEPGMDRRRIARHHSGYRLSDLHDLGSVVPIDWRPHVGVCRDWHRFRLHGSRIL